MKDIVIDLHVCHITIDYFSGRLSDYGLKVGVAILAYSTLDFDGALFAIGNTRKFDFDLFYLRQPVLYWLDR